MNVAAINFLPGVRFIEEFDGVTVKYEAMPDSEHPERVLRGAQASYWYMTTPEGRRPVLRDVIAAYLASTIHEIQEWLVVDGEKVFDPHPKNLRVESKMWTEIQFIADRAAGRMLRELPQKTTGKKKTGGNPKR